ncbi:MAG: hypothetical protein AAGA87_17900 [Pseudomonadota bacterium]
MSWGFFIVLSYALGQVAQGIGNTIEWAFWWPLGGLPSKRILDGETLTDQQTARLTASLKSHGIVGEAFSAADAKAAIREMYARVKASGHAERIDKFNGIYGMLRSLASALIVTALGCAMSDSDLSAVILLALAAALILRRMHRFGWHYGRELAVVYLATQSSQLGMVAKDQQNGS